MKQKSIEQIKSEWIELYEKDREELIEAAVVKCNNLRKKAEENSLTLIGESLIMYGFPLDGKWGAEWYTQNIVPEVKNRINGNYVFETSPINERLIHGFTDVRVTYHKN